MRKRKVGLIWLGHGDYLDETTAAIQRETIAAAAAIPGFSAEEDPIATTDAEAVRAVRTAMFERDCCGVVLVLTSWVECNVAMSAIKELRGVPCMLWGIPVDRGDGETIGSGSYVSASMLNGVVNRLQLRCPVLFAGTKTAEAAAFLADFAAAATAVDALFYCKIGLFGYTSMSIYPGTFDHVLTRYRIGPEIEQMDTYSLIRRAESADAEAVAHACERLRGLSHVCANVSEEILRKTMALYVAMSDFCREKDWAAVNVKCQYELSKEYRAVPCVALSLLAEDGVTASCEGDIPNTISMVLLQALSASVVWYGDALTHWGNTVQFSPCGFMPLTLACGTPNVQKFMEHPGFAGIQVSGVMRPEKVTFLRLVEDVGGHHLIYGTGQGVETSPRGGCMPALNVALDGDVGALIRAYAGQHYAIAYGDLSAGIEMYARLAGLDCIRV